MLGQIKPEFQGLKGEGQNTNVWTNGATMKMFRKKGQNSDVWTDIVRILMFGKIKSEF